MRILHIAAHLGGGVGRAHSALAETRHAARSTDEHAFVLLERPLDGAYLKALASAGVSVHVTPSTSELRTLAAEADIVQLEWWNHPKLYGLLASNVLPSCRLCVWTHISGLSAPLIPARLLDIADTVFFSSTCSFEAPTLRASIAARPEAFVTANSGFGFTGLARRASAPRPRMGYIGTLNFGKMHPRFFEFVDQPGLELDVQFWGRFDTTGDVASAALRMRHPWRVRFNDFTDDVTSVLSNLDVFLYLLSPFHYGTGENALKEAMSAGVVPIVFGNMVERSIVEDGRTGLVVNSKQEFRDAVTRIAADPLFREQLSAAAYEHAQRFFVPAYTTEVMDLAYRRLMDAGKRSRDFESALGASAGHWFEGTLDSDVASVANASLFSQERSKGSIGHFRAIYPEDDRLATMEAVGFQSARESEGGRRALKG